MTKKWVAIAKDQNASNSIVNAFRNNCFVIRDAIVMIAVIFRTLQNINKPLFRRLGEMLMDSMLRRIRRKNRTKKPLAWAFKLTRLRKAVSAEKHIVLKNIVSAIKVAWDVGPSVNVRTVRILQFLLATKVCRTFK